ncbi:hypothetical protein AG1IA_07601 [Rhizoctonia solani AG-1 IA]|uniref:Uncharacterized protein n=1 Tax=Thanatephorus cucumeris (strain AG1-IA) TaxID=983506 RepID=L8WKD7_THACA|nr:hypothetical protein AG1IA_07601 [Rhizoctonia solani AG-1 IA]
MSCGTSSIIKNSCTATLRLKTINEHDDPSSYELCKLSDVLMFSGSILIAWMDDSGQGIRISRQQRHVSRNLAKTDRRPKFHFLPALFFSRFFSLSICFCSARSLCISPTTLAIRCLYAASTSSCLFALSAARNLLSFLNSRSAPFLSFRYSARSLAAAARSWSGSCGLRPEY